MTTQLDQDGRAAASSSRTVNAAASAGPSLDDARVVQMLTAEHASLSAARSLAYNEAFTRADMFLGFLGTSLVALALIAQVLPLDSGLLPVATVILTFDLVVGVTTFGRIAAANYEDYLAVHGMARIRNAYQQIAPVMLPYVRSGIHDDLPGVMASYGSMPTSGRGSIVYALTTSGGMLALILSMLAAVTAFVATLLVGGSPAVALISGGAAAVVLFAILAASMYRYYTGKQAQIPVRFPTPHEDRELREEPT